MKTRIWFKMLLPLLILTSCNNTENPPADKKETKQEEKKETADKQNYIIVKEETFADTNEQMIRVTSEAISQNEFNEITKEIMEKYRPNNYDALHLYIHKKNGEQGYGELIAHSFIAYTDKGAQQVGLEKGGTYRLDIVEK
ncbi:MAG: hypothetical protein ACE3JP_04675 [Ectobacillus sp.]